MADKKVAGVAGFAFCVVVLILLLILYYPEKWFDTADDWPAETPSIMWNNFDTMEPRQPESKTEELFRILEDMGASFLALVAVLCVALGLAVLTCACCCLK